jgi:hypothetical protein
LLPPHLAGQIDCRDEHPIAEGAQSVSITRHGHGKEGSKRRQCHKQRLYGAGEEQRGKGDQDRDEVQRDRSGGQPKLQRGNEQRNCDQAQIQQGWLTQEEIGDHQRTNNDERSQ